MHINQCDTVRRFLTHIVCFLCVGFIIAMVTDNVATERYRSMDHRGFVIWQDIFNDSINADVVYLGSSRAADHYQPVIIDSILNIRSYNLGQYGKAIPDDIVRYHILRKYTSKVPGIVVWDLYFSSFVTANPFNDEQYAPFIDNDDLWAELQSQNLHFNYFDRHVPLLRYWKRGMFPNYDILPNPTRGFVYNRAEWNPSELRKLLENPNKCTIEDDVVKKFRKTVGEIKSNGSEVILVFSPMYCLGQQCITNLSEVVDTIRTVADEYNCRFINFLNSPICDDSTYFKNAMHLSEKGTDRFSADFADSLRLFYN